MNKQSKNKKRLKKLAKESKAKIEKNRMAIEEYCYQQISHLEFLNEFEKRSIAKSIARVPKNYARDSESIKDWWNYCQYPANFGGYLPHLNITICIGKLATISCLACWSGSFFIMDLKILPKNNNIIPKF